MSDDDAIEPDDKDWTWVLERPCPECGFDATVFGHDDVAGLLDANAVAWPAVLAGDGVRRAAARPTAGRHSSTPATSATSSACSTRACT